MPGPTADAFRAQIEQENTRQLLLHVRGALWITLATILLYAGVDRLLWSSSATGLYTLRFLTEVGIAAALAALYLRTDRAWITAITLLAVGIVLLHTALVGVRLGEGATTLLLAIILVTESASLLPWGIGPHSAVVAMGTAATAFTAFTIHGHDPAGLVYPAGAVVIAFGGSFYAARRLARGRRAATEQIVELRRTEEHLRRSEERFAAAVRGANDGIWDWNLEDNTFFFSPRWKEILGYADDELPSDFDEWRRRVHPDDRERFAVEMMVHVHGDLTHFENTHRLQHRDGSYRWVLARGLYMVGPDGNPNRVVGSLSDITEHKWIEEQLLQATAEAQAILRALPDVYCRLAADGRVLDYHVPPQDDSGVAAAPLDLRRMLPAVIADQLPDLIGQVHASGSLLTLEYFVPVNGHERNYELRMSPLRGGQAILIARDVSDRKRAEAELRRHQGELAHALRLSTMGQMAAELAHELNQPLAAIVSYAKGCVRRLRSGAGQPEEILDALEHISAQAVRGGEVIRHVREFVRKEPALQQRVNLNEVVERAVRFADPEAREHGIVVRLELTSGLPTVDVDAIQIEQVVLNLIRNGFEAMSDCAAGTRELVIQTGVFEPGAVGVAVRDCGAGVDPAIAERIFDPFFTTRPDGFGMGLSISRSIVESHGGRLWAAPNPDRGTTFRFTIPARKGESVHAA